MQPRFRSPKAGGDRVFLRDPARQHRLVSGEALDLFGGPAGRAPPALRPGIAGGAVAGHVSSGGRVQEANSRTGPAAGRPDPLPGGEERDATPTLHQLRQVIQRLEGFPLATSGIHLPVTVPPLPAPAPPLRPAHPDRLALGVADFDVLFAEGGLPLHALTELQTCETRDGGAVTGFLVALLVLLSARRPGPILWVREAKVAYELGQPAALGLLHLGLDPARLLIVRAPKAADVLAAVEDGLGTPALSAVIGEMGGVPDVLDLTASRRLMLRARERQIPAFLLLQGAEAQSSAAATRLAITPRPSGPVDRDRAAPGFPAFRVTVQKNRDGRPGVAEMEWRADDQRFVRLEPHDGDPVAASGDGPPRPPALGQVVAYRRPPGR